MKLRDHLGNLKRLMSQKTILIPSDFKRNQASYNDMRLSQSSKKLTNHGIKVMFNFLIFQRLLNRQHLNSIHRLNKKTKTGISTDRSWNTKIKSSLCMMTQRQKRVKCSVSKEQTSRIYTIFNITVPYTWALVQKRCTYLTIRAAM